MAGLVLGMLCTGHQKFLTENPGLRSMQPSPYAFGYRLMVSPKNFWNKWTITNDQQYNGHARAHASFERSRASVYGLGTSYVLATVLYNNYNNIIIINNYNSTRATESWWCRQVGKLSFSTAILGLRHKSYWALKHACDILDARCSSSETWQCKFVCETFSVDPRKSGGTLQGTFQRKETVPAPNQIAMGK